MIKKRIHRDALDQGSGGYTKSKEPVDSIVPWTENERELIKIKGIRLSSYGDFSGSSTHKYASGKVKTTGWCPTNVDPDDGSYDTSNFTTVYENFDKFLNGEIS